MTASVRLLLDRSGQGRIVDGYRIVETEAEFLRTALKGDKQAVRGANLCRWAEAFWQSRGWSYEEVRSPVDDLLSACPGLSEEQAQALLDALGDRVDSVTAPVSVLQLLELVLPGGPWEETPSVEHSAAWLLWLEDSAIPDYAMPLVGFQAAKWESECESAHRRLYRVLDPAESQHAVAAWIGLERGDGADDLGRFPGEIPQRWQQAARETWKREVVSKGPAAFDAVPAGSMPKRVKEIAADEVCSYCTHHNEAVTADLIKRLVPYLPGSRVQQLRDILPPVPPESPPLDPEALALWFTEQYLPYREWQAERNGPEPEAIVASVAADFARWYLDFYPVALAGGPGTQHLAMRRSEALRTAGDDCVTLWVVLDGLHFLDARRLISEITDQSVKLQIEQPSTTLTAIPTITRYAKPALITGLPPAQAIAATSTPSRLTALPESADPKASLGRAEKGDAFLWCHSEPDKTYHKPMDRATLLDNVYGVLKSLARKIAQAADAVPAELPLRVVISTDHGRLIGGGQRAHAVPVGMDAEGRAAYGDATVAFDGSGVTLVEGDGLAFLHRGRFGLPSDCAVVLDEDAFVMSDGKGGPGQFPHGGLFPEEAIIPWIELVRPTALPAIEGIVSGKARPTFDGNITLHLRNLSDVSVNLTRFALDLADGSSRTVDLEGAMGPYSEVTLAALLRGWPTHEQLREASGTITCKRETGGAFEIAVQLALESEQMYKQHTTLEDLM